MCVFIDYIRATVTIHQYNIYAKATFRPSMFREGAIFESGESHRRRNVEELPNNDSVGGPDSDHAECLFVGS